jgi:hypothetical protein
MEVMLGRHDSSSFHQVIMPEINYLVFDSDSEERKSANNRLVEEENK